MWRRFEVCPVSSSPWLILLLAIPLLPWVSVLMQRTDAATAMTIMPILLFLLSMMGVGAWIVWHRDPWLGALTAWWVVSLVWTRTPQAFESAEVCVLASLALTSLRWASADLRAIALRLVVIGVVAQALLGLVQAVALDPIWFTDVGVVGMVGNPAYLAGLLAPFVSLVSWPLAVVLLGVILLAHGKLAMVAAGLGLAVRYRDWWAELSLLGLLGAVGVAYWMGVDNLLANAYYRVTIWQLALSQMQGLDWLIGVGLGQWQTSVPALQQATQTFNGYYFTYAHSEWIQLLYESGLVAVVCVLGWLWAHRAMFQGEQAGAVVAILVLTTGWFVLHLANLALPFLVILCVASSRKEDADAGSAGTALGGAHGTRTGDAGVGDGAGLAVVGDR